ncbi:MAG: hypothetical protein UW93_C0004G0075 [Parcubacteria group bacterium GW2011_GWC1_45_13]|uniref:Uncharacterized protein n=2 Tax=Candidatus Giovannoniibacteriota TaxID=1752738 RepID=A0A0G1LW49_9BACT|nr:MAG: hypothetical protein UW49_C0004G0075 [Candidatus Giovannonibacteria bacterium GW2011_GWB1_44_23]KKT63964.1 MAG: hypothetical protein UW57_C0004G0074 [Candidatus Giovannonibacteria bacterium GW2011_GWA1_44_29]KKT91677.1 MAG: hypothetical protein UW93_C0004G0075 [Parcubacteria group bacterium GW2011_GWC1_45_13]
MQGLQKPQSYEEVNKKNAENVRASDFKNAGAEFPDAEEKSDGQKQDRKSAGVNAVN